MPDELLSVADVARLRKCDRTTAWRWLKTLEREHGAKLFRQNRTLFIDPAALRLIVAALPARNERRMAQQIDGLRRRVGELELRQKRTDEALREFRKLAHEWLTKKS